MDNQSAWDHGFIYCFLVSITSVDLDLLVFGGLISGRLESRRWQLDPPCPMALFVTVLIDIFGPSIIKVLGTLLFNPSIGSGLSVFVFFIGVFFQLHWFVVGNRKPRLELLENLDVFFNCFLCIFFTYLAHTRPIGGLR